MSFQKDKSGSAEYIHLDSWGLSPLPISLDERISSHGPTEVYWQVEYVMILTHNSPEVGN